MTTLDDKLLGEKTQNYCSSSSEDEAADEDKSAGATAATPDTKPVTAATKTSSPTPWQGYSQNTGPKGVIRDFELYKQHQASLQLQKHVALVESIKKTTITCKSYGDQLKEQKALVAEAGEGKDNKQASSPNEDLDELLDDDILKQFVQKRMEKLGKTTRVTALYPGHLKALDQPDDFLKIIEESDKRVPVVVHIYASSDKTCKRMNECLDGLSKNYDWIQFCSATVECVGVSKLFRSKGVPALLVYKGGELVGNFVQVGEELGEEFYPGDVENFLIENGVIS